MRLASRFVAVDLVEVPNISEPNDEGLTALHNAVCAANIDCVKALVEFGCDINYADNDGWTPLHCAASCNNTDIVEYLVEHGACLFAMTNRDQETPADKCEEDEENFHVCSQYLQRE
jgi:apoptosis-stimulating of p53 protein 1